MALWSPPEQGGVWRVGGGSEWWWGLHGDDRAHGPHEAHREQVDGNLPRCRGGASAGGTPRGPAPHLPPKGRPLGARRFCSGTTLAWREVGGQGAAVSILARCSVGSVHSWMAWRFGHCEGGARGTGSDLSGGAGNDPAVDVDSVALDLGHLQGVHHGEDAPESSEEVEEEDVGA
jgi:hypothetical protein